MLYGAILVGTLQFQTLNQIPDYKIFYLTSECKGDSPIPFSQYLKSRISPKTAIQGDLQVEDDVLDLSSEEKIRNFIWDTYPDIANSLTKLIKCESNYDQNRCGDGGLSCGVLQFKQATFDKFCLGDRNYIADQIDCAAKMIRDGGYRHWLNCWLAVGNPR